MRTAHCGLIGVAVFGLISDRRKLNLLEQRAKELSLIVGELEVSDPSQFHVKLVDAVADDHLLWRIYMPSHQSLRLSHASDEFPEPHDWVMIGPGTHKIEVRHHAPSSQADGDEHRIEILLDDSVAIQAARPAAWHTSGGWSGSGTVRESQAFDPKEPVELHRRRFHNPTAGGGSTSAAENQPTSGILLWLAPSPP